MDFKWYSYDISKHLFDNYWLENMFENELENLKWETFILFKLYLLENYPKIKWINLDDKFNNFCILYMKISLIEFVPYGWSKKKTLLAIFYLYDLLKTQSNIYFDFDNYINLKWKKWEKYNESFRLFSQYSINSISYQEIHSINDEDFYNNIYIKETSNSKISELLNDYLDLYKEGFFISKYELKDYKSTNNLFLNDISNVIKNTWVNVLDSNQNLHFLNNSELYYLTLIDFIKNNIFELWFKNHYEDYSSWDDKISYIKNNYNQLFEDLTEKNKTKKQSQEIKHISNLDEIFSSVDFFEQKIYEIWRKYKFKDETLWIIKQYAKIIWEYFDINVTIKEFSFLLEHLTVLNNKLDFWLYPSEEISIKIKDNIEINDEINKRLFDNNYHQVNIIKKWWNIKDLEGNLTISWEEKLMKLSNKYKFSDIWVVVHRGKIQKYDVTEKLNFKKSKQE